MQPKKHKKTNSRPNRAVWTVFVNCAHWRGSTFAIHKTVLIIFHLNLQTITITLEVVKWRWGDFKIKRNENNHFHNCWKIRIFADETNANNFPGSFPLFPTYLNSPPTNPGFQTPKKEATPNEVPISPSVNVASYSNCANCSDKLKKVTTSLGHRPKLKITTLPIKKRAKHSQLC